MAETGKNQQVTFKFLTGMCIVGVKQPYDVNSDPKAKDNGGSFNLKMFQVAFLESPYTT